MPDPRIVQIHVLPEAGTTHFQLEFSTALGSPGATDAAAWVPYDPTHASPTVPFDLPVSLLDASYYYLLDGINGATGNAAAASVGPLYRLRLQNAQGYGNWSQGFAASAVQAVVGAYYSPTAADIKRRTGVNRLIDQVTDAQLDATLLLLLPDAELRSALAVTPEFFDSTTLTARQVTALQVAVSKRTGAEYLRGIATEKVTATHSPLLMETAAAILAAADALEVEAEAYDRLAVGAPAVDGDGGTGVVVGPIPTLTAGTFEPGSLVYTPAERLAQLDERDDIPAWSGW